MPDSLVLLETDHRVATITLNRPEKLNALNGGLYGELDAALERADADEDVRAVVLAGKGRCFSVGADIGGEDTSGLLDRWEKYEAIHARQFRLWDFRKPLIAAVHGYCLGRGLELALWCDIVIASADARLGQPEVRDGAFVASLVPWVVGPQQAKWIMWTGDQMDAGEAQRIGLVTRVVPEGQALDEAAKLARRLTHLPPVTARSVKRWINGAREQQGLRSMQAAGPAFSALMAGMTAREKDIEELERIRREHGFRAYLEARDRPFGR